MSSQLKGSPTPARSGSPSTTEREASALDEIKPSMLDSFYKKVFTPLIDYLVVTNRICIPGNKAGTITQFRTIVNAFKGATLPFCIFLMWYYNRMGADCQCAKTLKTYTALHGSYGILWLLKDVIFKDPRFDSEVSTLSAINVSGLLLAYWIAPWLI